MHARRSGLLAVQEFRILRHDYVSLTILLVMPLVLMGFLKGALRPALVATGAPDGVTGAEQVVPGLAVTFAFFLVGNVGISFFREHGWGTWERLRASSATELEIMLGKTLAPLVLAFAQLTILFLCGGALFDLRVRGPWLGLFAVTLPFALSLVALGLLLTSFCRSIVQLNAIVNVGSLFLAGVGGALTPFSTLPSWARAIGPLTPSYWAMRGYQEVIIDGAGPGGVAPNVLVLLAFAVGLGVAAALRFRFEESKTFSL